MQILTFKRPMIIFIGLVLILHFSSSTSLAQQKTKIAGKHTFAYTNQTLIDVGDMEGHMILLSEFEGVNVSTGEHKFMDGAQDFGMTFADLVKGTGPYQGYGKFSLKGDTVFWKHEGKSITTLSDEGQPFTTYEGTFTYTKGTGKYQNIDGSGTYTGKNISRTIVVIEWEGEYFIKK